MCTLPLGPPQFGKGHRLHNKLVVIFETSSKNFVNWYFVLFQTLLGGRIHTQDLKTLGTQAHRQGLS